MEQTHPSDLIRLKVQGVVPDPNTETQVVILREARDDHQAEGLLIWVGAAEGNAIRLAMDGIIPPRPMTHDLIRSFMEHLSLKVARVVVTDVKNNTYYATIHLLVRGTEQAVDARPSDAIALALRTNSPIYVAQEVLRDRGGDNLDVWLEKLGTKNLGTYEV